LQQLAKSKAKQELTKKEIKKAKWKAICSSAKWFQIENRMWRDFFLEVQQEKNNPSIQQLIDSQGVCRVQHQHKNCTVCDKVLQKLFST